MALPRLRAPRADRAVLAVPPLAKAPLLAEANRRQFQTGSVKLLGRDLHQLRELARRDAVAAAKQFLASLDIPVPAHDSSAGLIMTGHQPDLFHPGVWIKNFAIHRLATKHGWTPLNLIVDGDVAKASSIRVPVPGAHPVQVSYDRWSRPLPYEELAVQDDDQFARFPERVLSTLSGCGFEPMVRPFWAGVMQSATQTPLLGPRLAGGRRLLEESWACRNLEVPMSSLCRTETFAWFACQLLAELPRFHAIHNDALRGYRQRRRIRGRNHPVPDLAADGDWLEAPFWVWRTGESMRDRLFARRRGDGVELRSRQGILGRLPLKLEAIDVWRSLEQEGLKVRTRALTTTLFARMLLAELFIHGIGGATYDEVTDEIIRGFYEIEAPGFLTLSATVLLPFPGAADRLPNPDQLRRLLRDLWYNPDRHVGGVEPADSAAAALRQKKSELIRQHPSNPAARWQRFQALHEINDRLRPFLAQEREALQRDLAEADRHTHLLRVAQDREYAFCLYPESLLREFFELALVGRSEAV